MAKAKPNGRCFVPTKERIQKVEELFQDFDIPSVVSNWDQLLDGHVQIVQGALQTGFELPKTSSWRLRKKKFSYNDQKRARRQTISNAERLKSYSDLKRAIMSFMRITGLVNILVWKP